MAAGQATDPPWRCRPADAPRTISGSRSDAPARNDRTFYFAVHDDSAADGAWRTEIAYGRGVGGCARGCANDHMIGRESGLAVLASDKSTDRYWYNFQK